MKSSEAAKVETESSLPPRWFQFRLRAVFALVWASAVIFAAMQWGWFSAVVFGLPVALLTGRVMAQGRVYSRNRYSEPLTIFFLMLSILMMGITLTLAILACRENGKPYNTQAWLAVVGAPLCVLALLLTFRGAVGTLLAIIPLAWLYHLVTPVLLLERHDVIDIAAGRHGVLHEPDLVFATPGRNTAYIESVVGEVEPRWEQLFAKSGKKVQWQKEFVTGDNYDLKAILKNLPTNESRRQMLRCLCNPENLARHHQAMLLVAVDVFGFPQELDADSWWRVHHHHFHEHKQEIVVMHLTLGWADKMNRVFSSMPLEYSPSQLNPVRRQILLSREELPGMRRYRSGEVCELYDPTVEEALYRQRELERSLARVVWWEPQGLASNEQLGR